MDLEILKNLLLLIAGGAFTALGAWLSDLRSERRRKQLKREEAYHAWLNNQSMAIRHLRELAEIAEREPETLEMCDVRLKKLECIDSCIEKVNSAFHLLLIYEKAPETKSLIEKQSVEYAMLARVLRSINNHHRTHLEFHTTIAETNEELLRLESMKQELEAMEQSLETGPESWDGIDRSKVAIDVQKSASKVAKLHRAIKRTRDRANEHLLNCSGRLCNHARKMLGRVEEMEKCSRTSRNAICV